MRNQFESFDLSPDSDEGQSPVEIKEGREEGEKKRTLLENTRFLLVDDSAGPRREILNSLNKIFAEVPGRISRADQIAEAPSAEETLEQLAVMFNNAKKQEAGSETGGEAEKIVIVLDRQFLRGKSDEVPDLTASDHLLRRLQEGQLSMRSAEVVDHEKTQEVKKFLEGVEIVMNSSFVDSEEELRKLQEKYPDVNIQGFLKVKGTERDPVAEIRSSLEKVGVELGADVGQ